METASIDESSENFAKKNEERQKEVASEVKNKWVSNSDYTPLLFFFRPYLYILIDLIF